jgi:hypothetical protein
MLLGAEIFFKKFSIQKRTRLGHPVLLETALGWILSGKIPESSYGHHATAAAAASCLTRVDLIDVQLQKFWEMEEFSSHPLLKEDRLCEAHFQRHTCRNEDGKCVVRLPIRPEVHQLGDSFKQAERRMHLLEEISEAATAT